jgi:hypothetical protein
VKLADVPLKYLYRTIHDDRLGEYLPTLGWYDGTRDRLRRGGPRPEREMLWFGRRGGRAFGCEVSAGEMQVAAWEMDTGKVDNLLRVADTQSMSVTLTKRGDIAAMAIDGTFRIHDGDDMGLKLCRQAPVRSVGAVDCLRLVNRNRLLGTTFITQRFWEADLKARRGWDCGRAAPGGGEVLKTWRVGKRIYMAAYSGGELMEYDPRRPAAFPANPRVVAQHPLAMRPVAAADHGPIIWYACSRKYGMLGTVLFRYDTRTGVASWVVDPLGPRIITTMLYDRAANELICGSSVHADQRTADPVVDRCMLARIGADDLAVNTTRPMPPQPVHQTRVIGWLRRGALLCVDLTDNYTPRVVDATTLEDIDFDLSPAISAAMSASPHRVLYLSRPGRFLLQVDGRLERHDFSGRNSRPQVLIRGLSDEHLDVDGQSLLLSKHGKVTVLHDVLRGGVEHGGS